MASLDTDFNVAPYFDDYDEDKRYHRMLFRPAVPLQARELTQLQTILQEQVERFGRYTFKEGSIVKGCSFSFDRTVKYAKILDKTQAGTDVNVNIFSTGDYVVNQANLVAEIRSTRTGLETQNPNLNTLFFNYINTGVNDETTFAAGETLVVYPALGEITSITVNDGGGGYDNSDIIVVSSTNGSGFIGNVVTFASNGTIKEISVTANGTGYTFNDLPTVSVTSNTGSNADLSCVLGSLANVTIASADFESAGNSQFNVVGSGFEMTTTDGYIFQKGHFIKVEEQSIIVTPYTNVPHDIVVGFRTTEEIVNSSIDTSLLDNASGFNNENAPGADRLKLTANLVVNTSSVAISTNNFLSLVKFTNGKVSELSKTARLNVLGSQIAQRTYEESGDYVVEPFAISTEVRGAPSGANTTHINAVIGPGVAYPKGYRFETIGPSRIPIRKATDTANADNQSVTTNYGHYIQINEAVGQFGHSTGDMVLLLSAAHDSLSSNTNPTLSGSEYNNSTRQVTYNGVTSDVVGTARVRSIELASENAGRADSKYNLYLFDIKMNTGKSFLKHAKALYHYSGTAYTATDAETNRTVYGIADIVLSSSGTATLIDVQSRPLVFPLGQTGVKNISDEVSFVYKTSANVTFAAATGTTQFAVSDPKEFNFGTSSVTLSTEQERQVLVVPTSSANASTVTTNGTAAVSNATTTTVTGSNTSDLIIGDLVYVSNSTVNALRQITGIVNSSAFTVNKSFGGSMASANVLLTYQTGVPIPFNERSIATMAVDNAGRRLTIDVGRALSTDLDATVIHDIKDTSNAGLKKTIDVSIVKLDTATHAAGANGPWSLGLPDVFEILAVYVDTSYATSGTNRLSHFTLDPNQKDGLYGLSRLRKKASSSLNTTSKKITVVVRNFVKDTSVGTGYFSIKSYVDVINDTTSSNTTIATQNIPIYVSPQTGREYNLRNSIDFRSVPTATANTGETLANATENPSSVELLDGQQYYPAPDEAWEGEVEYYLPRKDRLVLDGQNFSVIEGVASSKPTSPSTPSTMMSIAEISVPVYPSLDTVTAKADRRPDLAVVLRSTQLQRYTMRDIKSIDDRLRNIEYYTALNTLESLSTQKVIPGRTDPSINRFKNGIIVDNFEGPVTGNPLDVEFKAGYDLSRKRLTSKFETYRLGMKIETKSNTRQHNDLVLLNSFSTRVLQQTAASSTRVCTAAFWQYTGTLELFPDYHDGVDFNAPPVKQNVIDINLAGVTEGIIDELNKVIPVLTSEPTVVSADVQISEAGQTTSGSTTTTSYQATLETQVRTVEASFSSSQSTTSTKQVGDFITNISFSPYVPPINITFRAYGLRPNLVHHVFFDEQNVDAHVRPGRLRGITNSDEDLNLSTSQIERMFSKTNAKGAELRSDARGVLVGQFQVPAETFFVGDRKMVVADIEDLSDIANKVSSASGKFGCFNFSAERQSIVTSTRSAIPSSRTQANIRSVLDRTSFQTVDQDEATTTTVTNVTNVTNVTEVTEVTNQSFTTVINEITEAPEATPEPPPEPVVVPNATPNTTPQFTCAFLNQQIVDGRIPQSFDVTSVPPERILDCFGTINMPDPLAQSFLVTATMTNGAKGAYATGLEIFFAEKDPVLGCTVELREMVNGVPGSRIVPFSKTKLTSSKVGVSSNAALATQVVFRSPVYVEAGKEYAIVILPDGNSPNYRVWTARAGFNDIRTGKQINQDWGQGTMFLSTNNRTWTEMVDEDMKFSVLFARMRSFEGSVDLVNEDYEWFTATDQTINGTFSSGEEVFQVGTNASGNVAFTAGQSTIVGTGTTFTGSPTITVGDRIVLTDGTNHDVVTINSISNSTHMTITGGVSFTSSSAKYQFTPTGVFDRVDPATGTVVINQSTATNSTFIFAAGETIKGAQSSANFVINAVEDTNISYMEPQVTRITPSDTKIRTRVQGKKVTGSGLDTFRVIPHNDRTYPIVPIKVMSKSNEILNNSGNKSFRMRHELDTINLNTSPAIDLQSQSVFVYENIINNSTTNEYLGESGEASAKYVSRILTLADDLSAEDLKCYIRAYKPAGTNITVYAKVINEADTSSARDTHWSLLQEVDPNRGKFSSSVDRGDIIEYTYEFLDTPQSTKKGGTVTITSGSTTVTGSGTTFTSDYAVGDLIKITQGGDNSVDYQISKITAIASDTSLTIADDAAFTLPLGEAHYRVNDEYKRQVFRDPNADTNFMATYYNAEGEKFVGYSTLQIKIVMTSTSTALAPTLSDFRAIAVSL